MAGRTRQNRRLRVSCRIIQGRPFYGACLFYFFFCLAGNKLVGGLPVMDVVFSSVESCFGTKHRVVL